MNRETSVYLDLVRFVQPPSSIFLTHAGLACGFPADCSEQVSYGREAVDVFFVLSGFVIGHVVETREHSAFELCDWRGRRGSIRSRCPAGERSALSCWTASASRCRLYVDWCCNALGGWAWEYLRQPGIPQRDLVAPRAAGLGPAVLVAGLRGLVAHVAFGLAWFAAAAAVEPDRRRAGAGGGGPRASRCCSRHGSLGFWCYRLCHARGYWGAASASCCAMGALLSFFVYEHWASPVTARLYSPSALSPERLHDYAQDYIVGGLFALHLIGFLHAASAESLALLLRCERPIPLDRQGVVHAVSVPCAAAPRGGGAGAVAGGDLADAGAGVHRRAAAGAGAGRGDGAA